MIKIKVCGMYDPLNVKEIAEANPDYLGFIFYDGSPRYVGTEPDSTLFANVPDDIIKTGVFVNENSDRILYLSQMAGLGMIQLHGNESPEFCSRLKSAGLIIMKTFNIGDDFDFEKIRPYIPFCEYFLFDTKTDKIGGSGRKFNWEKLDGYYLDKPFFLSGGVRPEDSDVISAIRNRGLFAVDINSGFEISPGIKNVDHVQTFINAIKRIRYVL